TSRPPWRSRPLRIGLWIGEPGIPIATTSASVARISPSRIRGERRSDTEARPGSLAFVLRNRGLCGLFVRLFVRLLVVLGLDLPGDRTPGDANHRPGGDLEVELVVAHRLDAAVEPACGDDLVARAQAREELLLRRLPAPIRPDEHEPREGEKQQDDQKAGVHEASTPAPARRSSASAL